MRVKILLAVFSIILALILNFNYAFNGYGYATSKLFIEANADTPPSGESGTDTGSGTGTGMGDGNNTSTNDDNFNTSDDCCIPILGTPCRLRINWYVSSVVCQTGYTYYIYDIEWNPISEKYDTLLLKTLVSNVIPIEASTSDYYTRTPHFESISIDTPTCLDDPFEGNCNVCEEITARCPSFQ